MGRQVIMIVGGLATRHMNAFANRIANVAEHEQIPGRGAGKAGDIVGRTGDEAMSKALGRVGRLRGRAIGSLDALGERRLDRNAALTGQVEEA